MPFIELGQLPDPIRLGNFLDAKNIRGGTISAQEIVIAGGTTGAIRSENYDGSSMGWAILGDGSASFYGTLTIGANAVVLGDIYSSAWNGTIPANLASGPDTGATAGYYLDSSAGVAQFQELLVGSADGHIKLEPFAALSSIIFSVDVLDFDGVITMNETNIGGGSIGTVAISPPYDAGAENVQLLMRKAATGDGGSYMSLLGDFFHVGGGTNGEPKMVAAADEAEPAFSFVGDEDTGIYRAGTNKMGFVAGGDEKWTIGGGGDLTAARGNDIVLPYADTTKYSSGEAGFKFTVSTAENFAIQCDIGSGFVNRFQLQDEGGAIFYDDGGNQVLKVAGAAGAAPQLEMEYGTAALPAYSFTGDDDTGMFRSGANDIGFSGGGTEILKLVNADNALYIYDTFDDVGNHETLRADRGSVGLAEVGYYSSWEIDPDTGKRKKKNLVGLGRTPLWRREWFMDIKPVKYERTSRTRADGSRKPWRVRPLEIGFTMENLLENTNLLTTKGAEPGYSPDEFALMAVTVDYVQHLEERVAALEEKLFALA